MSHVEGGVCLSHMTSGTTKREKAIERDYMMAGRVYVRFTDIPAWSVGDMLVDRLMSR